MYFSINLSLKKSELYVLQIKIEVNRKKKSKTTCEKSLMSTLIFV